MARLDAFIERLVAAPGSELVFQTSEGALLSAPEGPRRLVRQPLSTSQIVGAFAEIVPADLQAGFPQLGATVFPYLAPTGAVEVRFEASGDAVRAVIRALAQPASAEVFDPSPAPFGFEDAALSEPPPPAAESDTPAPPAPEAAPLPPDAAAAMERLLAAMLERGASDLHLSSGNPPSLRVDGDITPLAGFGAIGPDRLAAMLWTIAPAKSREEFEERSDTDFAHETPAARFRVNVFRDRKGIGAVLRQIPSRILTAEEMGIPKAVLDLCFLPKGLVLVTGPTGSGKSTTLAALVDFVNRNRDDHIITIEDPIEFVHQDRRCLVNQREVGTHTGSFKAALRAALREDPDVVLVGELRDLETIAIAIETAETGHLVFGTLHTNTAPSTVDRIIDQFPPDRQAQIRMMLSESLRGVITQTLCKRIGGGRVPAMEILLCSSGVANLIREGKTFQIPSVMQTARGQGMLTLNDSLVDLVKRKLVEPKEAWAKAVAKAELKQQLERAGFSVPS
ncbi:MAG TPA: type IV pilus twitching motility protein PilT [Anaeromyxobacteraceae bacterium]|nr:type IV pilus twitching motility protein PilT [Anaeromyxobacteraceae bacterium]